MILTICPIVASQILIQSSCASHFPEGNNFFTGESLPWKKTKISPSGYELKHRYKNRIIEHIYTLHFESWRFKLYVIIRSFVLYNSFGLISVMPDTYKRVLFLVQYQPETGMFVFPGE